MLRERESKFRAKNIPQREDYPAEEDLVSELQTQNQIYPQREGATLAVLVPIWLVLPKCEATSLGVFDLCLCALLKRGCATLGGFGARWSWLGPSEFPNQNLSIGRREKTPTPKTRFSIWTLPRTPGRFTTRPLPVHFTTKMSVVRPFSVLSKDESGP